MGKVSRRLTIIVFPPLDKWSEVVKLGEQGHRIIADIHITDGDHPAPFDVAWGIIKNADLIIGPQCWMFDQKHRRYLTQAIKQARIKRYGAPSKKAGKKDAEDADIPFGDGPDTGKP